MSEPWRELVVSDEQAGKRAEQIVKEALDASRAETRALFDSKQVRSGEGRSLRRGDRARVGDIVRFPDLAASPWIKAAPELSVTVLFEAPDVVVVDKPAGLHAHPLVRGEPPTLAHAVAALFPEVTTASEHPREGGITHRLDEHTSGVAVFARSGAAWLELRDAFTAGEVKKRYLALVAGRVARVVATEAPIAHHATDPSRMVVAAEQQSHRGEPLAAFSELTPLLVGDADSLVVVTCHSGRRHQVRVHCAHLGHPLVGDPLYGGPEAGAAGPLLHAAALRLPDGREVSAPDLSRLWSYLPVQPDQQALVETWLRACPFETPPPAGSVTPETG